MYALIFLDEGCYNNLPYSSVIAVSNDITTIEKEMKECVENNLRVTDEDDPEYYDCNFRIVKEYDREVILQNINFNEQYIKYTIQMTQQI